MDTMKRSLLAAVAGLALVASGAFAQNVDPKTAPAVSQAVQLSDAELDNITAGTAQHTTVVMNAGKANVFNFDGVKRAQCINCAEFPVPGVERLHVVINPAQTVFKCVGVACP
jgi:hypothetical protein